ncbi:MAG: sulfotransferase domain-containing protein [Gammaproteobacteria bacterium]|nr:sulfotransferase domain-containing protein [Gammaproteobacteria bacterium]
MDTYRPAVTWNLSRKGRLYREASALVLSIPKSGRTWFRVILSKYLALHFGQQIDIGGYNAAQAVVPNILYSHEMWSHRMTDSIRRRLLGFYICPDPVLRKKPVMVVHRDPRDVLVSLYFHARKRSRRQYKGSISELVRDDLRGVRAMVVLLNTWRQRLADKPDVLWVGYADLHTNPFELVNMAIHILGIEPNADYINAAIAFSQFGNMRKLEEEGGLGQGFLSPRDSKDPESFKVRSGKVGGYRQYLNDGDLAYIDQALDELDPFFGYSSPGANSSSPR